MSLLLPEGVTHLADAPYILHSAIIHGLRILNYEEHPIDERPPKRIWMDEKGLTAHWDEMDLQREAKYKLDRPEKEAPEGPVQENAVELLIKRG